MGAVREGARTARCVRQLGGDPGGSRELLDLIEEHHSAIEYDLRAYCGVRLTDVFRPGSDLTAREVLSLLSEVPEEGAFVASLHGTRPPGQKPAPAPPDGSPAARMLARRRFRGWGPDRELLAQIRDAIGSAGYKQHYPRPEAAAPARAVLSLEASINF